MYVTLTNEALLVFFRFLFLVTLVANATMAFAEATSLELKEVIELLNEFGIIRVPIADAPGSGHQAASSLLVKQLRQMGYRGEFDIVYPHSAKSKLEYLLPPFRASGPDDQYLPEWKARVREFSSRNSWEPLPVGITGAMDGSLSPSVIHTRVLIRIQPANWLNPPSIEIASPVNDSAVFPLLRSLPSIYEAPRPANVKEFLSEQFSHSEVLSGKKVGLTEILLAQQEDHIQTLTSYGFGGSHNMKIALLLNSLAAAISDRPEMFNKPVLVNFISDLNSDQWKDVLTLLYPETKRKLEILSVTDRHVRQKIDQAKMGEILAVNTGNVTQDVFNYLIDSSSLPPTAIGTGAINFLSTRGKPFLPLMSEAKHNRSIYFPRNLGDVAAAFTMPDLMEDGIKIVSDFLIRCHDSSSEACDKFVSESKKLLKQQDRTCAVLLASYPVLQGLRSCQSNCDLAKTLESLKAEKGSPFAK